MSRCASEGCEGIAKNSRWCRKHRARIERHGNPDIVIAPEDRNLATGARNPNWTGEDATYAAIHQRLRRRRGPARNYSCVDCGGAAAHWSYSREYGCNARLGEFGPYSVDIDEYDPRCVACHKKFDLAHAGEVERMVRQ